MASVQLSTTVRNAQAGVIETAIGTAPKVNFLDGSLPADCAAADPANVLCTVDCPSQWLESPVAGAVTITGSWVGIGLGSGYIRHFRLMNNGNTVCHMQGLVSQDWESATAYALTQQVNNGGNVYVCTTGGTSDSGGGPTGTGTGIVDNDVVWDYVGPVGMVLENTHIASDQGVNITQFTLTVGNA